MPATRQSARSSSAAMTTAHTPATPPSNSKRVSSPSTSRRSDRELMPPPPPKKRRSATPPQSPQTQRTAPTSQTAAERRAAEEEESVGQRNYGEEGYWEERYKRQLDRVKRREAQQQEEKKSAAEEDDEDDITSEWYYDWKTLTPLLDLTHAMRQSPVLDLGCGLSSLFAHLLADGFTGPMLGIDSAPSVLTEQRSRFPAASFPAISFSPRSLFSTAYLTATPSERHRYGLIVDKATSDGIMCSTYLATPAPTTQLPVIHMYRMVGHCLAPGGTFVCVSVQEPDSGWCKELMLAGLIEGAEGQAGAEERKEGEQAAAESSGGRKWGWRVDVHSIGGDGDAEYYDGEKEGPNVYIVQKLSRERRSRAAKRGPTSEQSDDAITISRHFH